MRRRTFIGAVASAVSATLLAAERARKIARVGYVGTNRDFALGQAISTSSICGEPLTIARNAASKS